jgi:hypothetical protein
VLQAAGALIDRLGLGDAVGVIRIPIPRDSRLTLTTLRPELREVLRQVTAKAAQPGASASAGMEPRPSEPVRAAGRTGDEPGTERAPVDINADLHAAGDESLPARDFLGSFRSVLAALEAAPGRKVIVVFSGGLLSASVARPEDVARAAIAAGVVVHAFGIPGIHGDLATAPDLAALERLAKATGGSYVTLGRSPERSVERLVTELAACYVLGIESVPSDSDSGRHAVRVETPRLPLTLRAPAWIVARAEAPDIVPEAAAPPRESARAPGRPRVRLRLGLSA